MDHLIGGLVGVGAVAIAVVPQTVAKRHPMTSGDCLVMLIAKLVKVGGL